MRSSDILLSFLILGIFFSLYFINIYIVGINSIKSNWDKYKCNPTIIPFAWLFGKDTKTNMLECVNNVKTNNFADALLPFEYVFNLFTDVFTCQNKSFGSSFSILGEIQNTISKIFNFFISFVSNIVFESQRVLLVVKDTIFKSLGIVIAFINAIETMLSLTESALNSTLVKTVFKLGDFVACFHPNTTLQLVDNTPVLIKDIKINDILHDHTRVNGIVKLVNQKETFYKLNDILVTGEHFVEFNHTWIRVKHHPDAIKQSIDTEFVYCLSTTTNKIPIGNYVFHDWNDDLIQENELCKQSIYYSTNIIHENCNIDKHLAKDIPMYSKIQDSQVLGILHIQLDTTTYVIHEAIVNEYQKVFHNNKWVCAKDYPDKQVYKKGPQRLIGFITDKKKIKINDIVFQDEYYM